MLVNFWYVHKTAWIFIRIVFCLLFPQKNHLVFCTITLIVYEKIACLHFFFFFFSLLIFQVVNTWPDCGICIVYGMEDHKS